MEVKLLAETKIVFADNGQAAEILGYQDKYLRLIENALKVHLIARGDELTISGDDDRVAAAQKVFKHLQTLAADGIAISPLTVNYALAALKDDNTDIASLLTHTIYTTPRGKTIKPKSFGQWQYLKAIDEHCLLYTSNDVAGYRTWPGLLLGRFI